MGKPAFLREEAANLSPFLPNITHLTTRLYSSMDHQETLESG
jgi:hypothetical protein